MKTKISKLIFLITTFLFFSNEVMAAYITLEQAYNESNMEIYRNISGEYDEQTFIWITENDKDYHGYCLDSNLSLHGDTKISKYAENATEYLNKYFKNQEKSTELEKAINRYIYFGYNYNNQKNYKYLLATQKLIWDELYKANYNSEDYRNGVYFYTYNEENETESKINITNETNKIKNNISAYLKTPSFCNSTIEDLTVGESITIEDSENVLSQFKVTCTDELTCKINDNKLVITANSKKTDSTTITLSKEGNKNKNAIYKNEDEQGVIINNGAIDGVSCQFNVKLKDKPTPVPSSSSPKPSSSSPKPSSSTNVTVNPPTGNIALFLILSIVLFSLSFSIWYFIKMKNNIES